MYKPTYADILLSNPKTGTDRWKAPSAWLPNLPLSLTHLLSAEGTFLGGSIRIFGSHSPGGSTMTSSRNSSIPAIRSSRLRALYATSLKSCRERGRGRGRAAPSLLVGAHPLCVHRKALGTMAPAAHCPQVFFLFLFLFFGLFGATPTAYGRSQARGQIRAAAASPHHNHNNTRSKTQLQPTPHLMATLDP